MQEPGEEVAKAGKHLEIPEYIKVFAIKDGEYEAVNRAKERGAKRAIVLSDQDFYKCLGMIKSSEVGTWVRNSK
ncbi:hypothetical protein D7V86_14920 [bacterium D16-51]|nr:hypothetical protein D7V96_02205 [bacterium D16-59]RKI58845.1 hypothetical protein D7V86_14920 [bacterium D16-51]